VNVINHLSTLETAGLVRLAQVTPDLEYLFRHTLVQDAAYASLLQQDQSRLHLRVAEALEEIYPGRIDDISPTLARHFECGGDPEQAVAHYRRAAEHALASFANNEATSYCKAALQLIDQLANPTELRCSLQHILGEALYVQGELAKAREAWRAAITTYLKLGNLDQAAHLYARSGRAAWFEHDLPLSLAICEEGLQEVAEAPESPGKASLIHETGRALFFNGQAEQAIDPVRKAYKMGERLAAAGIPGAVAVQADALTTLGLLPGLSPTEIIEHQKQAVELAESAGLYAIATRAHINLGSAYREYENNPDKCRFHFMRSAELSRRRGALQEEAFALVAVLNLLANIGNLDELDRMLPEAEKLVANLPNPGQVLYTLKASQAMAIGMRGRWKEALPFLLQSRIETREHGDHKMSLGFSDVIIQVVQELYQLGQIEDLEMALQVMEEDLPLVLAELANSPHGDTAFWFLAHTIGLLVSSGRIPEAQAHLDTLKKIVDPSQDLLMLPLHEAEIEILLGLGKLNDALEKYEQIGRSSLRINPYFYARTLTRWAETLIQRGEVEDLERSQSLLLEALDIFQKLKALPFIAQVEQLLQLSRRQTMAQAVEQRKIDQELAQARRVQASFLPENPPALPGWEIAVAFHPARQTSGDFYDFITLPDGHVALAISDVADKGMGAALYMASARSLLRAYLADFPGQPLEVIQRSNQRLTSDTHGGLFVTLFFGILNPQTGELLYVNAGHNPPCLFQPGLPPQTLTKTGIPLGIFEDANWKMAHTDMPPGSLFVLYTDGVTETIDANENQFGEERLLTAIEAGLAGSVSEICAHVLTEITAHRGTGPQTDDLTLMVIRRM
jgi:serine phosphatase RsbU (regulator of sigma subunit)